MSFKHTDITEFIIKAFYKVYNIFTRLVYCLILAKPEIKRKAFDNSRKGRQVTSLKDQSKSASSAFICVLFKNECI